MNEFENRVVIVTGCSLGIGRKIAEDFLKLNSRVIGIDLENCDLDLDFFYKGDISKKDVLEDFINEVSNKFEEIDILVNNACPHPKGIFNCSYDEFLDFQKIGVVAPYYLTKLLVDKFSVDASIVNIASTRAAQSQINTEAYSAVKGGILSLTHSLAVSLSGKVRVNAISPGWIDTKDYEITQIDKEQHLVKRVGKPQDISSAVQFLCSQKNSFISGENIVIDGGMSKLMIYHNDHGWNYNP